MQDGSIGDVRLSIALRVCNRDVGVVIFKDFVIELLPIINDRDSRKAKPTDYGPPDDVPCLLTGDMHEQLDLYPLGEVVHYYNEESPLPSGLGKGRVCRFLTK